MAFVVEYLKGGIVSFLHNGKSGEIKSYVKTYGSRKLLCFLDKTRRLVYLDGDIGGKKKKRKPDNNKLYSKSIEISSYGLCSLRDDRGYYTT